METNVIMNKSVTLKGEDEKNTIINGKDFFGYNVNPVIKIVSNNCVVGEFTVMNGCTGVSLNHANNSVITNNCIKCNKHIYPYCYIICCDQGIYLLYLYNNIINNNDIIYNGDTGIRLYSSSDTTTSNNNILNNKGDGITAYPSVISYPPHSSYNVNNTIINNSISNNLNTGIDIRYSSNNKIYLNNFINNSNNVYSDASANIWNSTEKITYIYNKTTYESHIGNFWDDYNGTDDDTDGIGDAPYTIDSDQDNHPLIEILNGGQNDKQ